MTDQVKKAWLIPQNRDAMIQKEDLDKLRQTSFVEIKQTTKGVILSTKSGGTEDEGWLESTLKRILKREDISNFEKVL